MAPKILLIEKRKIAHPVSINRYWIKCHKKNVLCVEKAINTFGIDAATHTSSIQPRSQGQSKKINRMNKWALLR